MKPLWISIFSICLTLAMVACAPDDKGGSSTPKPTPTPEVQKINGMNVDEFYGQFYFKTSGQCSPNLVKYEYPKSSIVQVGVNPQNAPVFANLSLIMKDDHTFKAIYREFMRIGFGNFLVVTNEKVISGKWKVEDTTLQLEGLGASIGLISNNGPALRLRFLKDIVQPGIQNRTLLLEITNENIAPLPEYNPCDL